jgi:hypothetical protein
LALRACRLNRLEAARSHMLVGLLRCPIVEEHDEFLKVAVRLLAVFELTPDLLRQRSASRSMRQPLIIVLTLMTSAKIGKLTRIEAIASSARFVRIF